jgi:hypothetical protein
MMDPRVKPAGDVLVCRSRSRPSVMAGLDPAIHPFAKKLVAKKMDPRVKPAGDQW